MPALAQRQYSQFIRLIHLLGDVLLLNGSFVLAYAYKFDALDERLWEGDYRLLWLVINAAWLAGTALLDTYQYTRLAEYRYTLTKIARAALLNMLLVALFWMAYKAYYYSREQLLITYLVFGSSLLLWRMGFVFALRAYRLRGFNYRRVAIIGYGQLGRQLRSFFAANPELGYRVVGTYDNQPDPSQDVQATDLAEQYILHHPLDEVYLTLPQLEHATAQRIIRAADARFIQVKILPDFSGFDVQQVQVRFMGGLPVLGIRQHPLDDALNRFVKRLFDISLALAFFLLLGWWLFPLLALLVRLSSPGPVFFKQKRSGRGGKAFTCYKLRTMRVNNDADAKQATATDPRITPIGRFLRRSNLDELPQFWNILRGEMSVVGPRPHMLKHTEEYAQQIERFMFRHLVKPGLTGLAQAKGYRGATPTLQYMEHRVRMDNFYVNNWSLVLDLKIIVLTMLAMLRGNKNAV